jgi:DNA-binding HxlR family transcriptional regulator
MAAMDLLGRRWALRILWELRAGPLGARALQARCDQMSSSVLYERLDELAAARLLTRDGAGAYLLTDLGAALAPALESLDSWARRWAEVLQGPAGTRAVHRARYLSRRHLQTRPADRGAEDPGRRR